MKKEEGKKGMSTGVKVLLGCGSCLGVLVVGGIGLSALGLFGAVKVIDEVDKSIEAQEQLSQDKKANPYSLGEEVTVEDVVWKVISAEEKGNSLPSNSSFGDDCVSNSGKFIQVRATVTNNSNDMQSFGGLNIYDKDGREYVNSSDVFGCVEDEFLLLDNINPGLTTEFIQTYEVPTDASGFILKVTDLNFLSDNHDFVGLGF